MAKNKPDEAIDLEVEYVAVETLKPHPRNYRAHPPDQLEHIVVSLRENGFYRNIVIAKDNTILAGHGVVQAVKELGYATVPAIRLDIEPNDRRAIKVMMADNEISRGAVVDDRLLTELLREVMGNDPVGLLGTGYTDAQLAALVMVTRGVDEIADFNAAAHWVGMPEYDQGNPLYTATFFFKSVEERDQFVAASGADLKLGRVHGAGGYQWSTHWPEQRPADIKSVMLVAK